MKSKLNGRASGSMQDYFPHNSSPTLAGLTERQMAKIMVMLETEEEETYKMALTHKDLLALSEALKQHFTSLLDRKLDSFLKKLSSFMTTIKDVSSTADAAYDLSESQEHRIKELQVSERMLKEQVAWLEGKARDKNLKFHGLPELLKLNSNLKLDLASLLALILSLDDWVAPTIIAAYRMGPASAAKPNFCWDIVAQFLYNRSKEAVLQTT